MAIVQEDRLDAPRPEVNETEYGAQYVKAATETPVEQPKDEPLSEESVEQTETTEEAVEVKQPVRKGRPRKKK